MKKTIPGTNVKYVEMSDMPQTDRCEKYLESEPRFKRGPAEPDVVSVQWLKDKLAKNNSWSVTGNGVDVKNKHFWFDVGLNADLVERKFIPFENVNKIMHWTKFEFINAGTHVRFAEDETWYLPLGEQPKKRGRKKKVVVENRVNRTV